MGQIGKFIDAVCDTHPHLMRAVLEKPLAPLTAWIDFDNSGQLCGCLIGTAALAAGFEAQTRPGYLGVGLVVANEHDAPKFLGAHLGRSWFAVEDVGVQVADISMRIGDERTVHLIRARIARQLAVRESALGVGAPRLPNEPVEHTPALRRLAGARG